MKKILTSTLFVLWMVGCGGAAGSTHTTQEVIDTFHAASLDAESQTTMEKDDYGLAPFVGQGVHFLIPSAGDNVGGRVIAVEDKDDRERLATYYESLGEQSAAFFSWVFVKDNIVVQLNGSLEEDVARQYEAALNGME